MAKIIGSLPRIFLSAAIILGELALWRGKLSSEEIAFLHPRPANQEDFSQNSQVGLTIRPDQSVYQQETGLTYYKDQPFTGYVKCQHEKRRYGEEVFISGETVRHRIWNHQGNLIFEFRKNETSTFSVWYFSNGGKQKEWITRSGGIEIILHWNDQGEALPESEEYISAAPLGIKWYPTLFNPVIESVSEKSPAWRANLLPGDQIISVSGLTVETIKDFLARLRTCESGTKTALLVKRKQVQVTLSLEIPKRSWQKKIDTKIMSEKDGYRINVDIENDYFIQGQDQSVMLEIKECFFEDSLGTEEEFKNRLLMMHVYDDAGKEVALSGGQSDFPILGGFGKATSLPPGDYLVKLENSVVGWLGPWKVTIAPKAKP